MTIPLVRLEYSKGGDCIMFRHCCSCCIQLVVLETIAQDMYCCDSTSLSAVSFCYVGKFKAAELISFLKAQAGSAADSEAGDSSADGAEEGKRSKQKKEEQKDPQIVKELNLTEFEGLSDEEDAWLVAFYSGAASDKLTH